MYLRLLAVKIQSLKYDNPSFQVEVEWDITQRCNYSCSYCASYNNTQPFNFKELDEYLDSFEYLSNFFGNKTIKINFLGGEPTLFKQWVKLVNWLSENNFVIKLTTNLSVPVIQYIKVLNVGLGNFISASYHTEFADLDKFYENANYLHHAGFLHSITLLPDPKNWDYSMKCYEKLSKITTVSLNKIKNEFTDSVGISGDFIEYSDEQLKMFNQVPRRVDENMSIIVDGETKHPSLYEIREKYSNFKGMKCAIGRDRIHIKPNGDIYPSACLLNYPRAKMGNIFKKNIIKPKNAVICPFNECLCGPDIRIEKWA